MTGTLADVRETAPNVDLDEVPVTEEKRRRKWRSLRPHPRRGHELRDLDLVDELLKKRTSVLKSAREQLRELGYDDAETKRLAAVDLFVEKAQRVLSVRARRMFGMGALCALGSVLVLGGTLLMSFARADGMDPRLVADSTQLVVLNIFQTLALGAIAYVAVKLLVSLARSFFHEAVVLWERRHALRFGRMWVHLAPVGELELDQLVEAFQWNRSGATSFQDIKPEVITETLFHAVLKSPEAVARAVLALRRPDDATAIASASAQKP